MLRMIWRPQAPPAGLGPSVLRLEDGDITDLQDFYRMREGSVFGPAQLSAGVYYGVRQNGQLVSAAGTHLVSQAYRLAAIGNVFTLPEHCGRGLATACTAAVLVELAAGGYEIALNVGTSNGAAIHIYSRLGFVEHCRFVEAAVTRKGAKGTSQRL
jgi:predicted GNAT family acetyltransferase